MFLARWSAAIFVLGCLLGCCEGEAAAASWTFQPEWTVGRFWVVKSARHAERIDPETEAAREIPGGWYYTRFRVIEVENGPAGKSVKIEIRHIENDFYTYEGQPRYAVLNVSLGAGRLGDLELCSETETGETTCRRIPTYLPGQAATSPYWYPGSPLSAIPPSLVLLWPVLSVNRTGGLVLTDAQGSEEGGSFTQRVRLDGTGATVTIAFPASGDTFRLRFAPGLPWYEVVDCEGVKTNEIVQVGTRP